MRVQASVIKLSVIVKIIDGINGMIG